MTLRRLFFFIPSLFATAVYAGAPTPTINDLVARLNSLDNYSAKANFTVSMPQLAEDITYDVTLHQKSSPGDPLGCETYLIDWILTGDKGGQSGFTAYFDGNFYRHSGERLQEYHLSQDSVPFLPGLIGSRGQGVHRSAQFFNMLPQSIAVEITKMIADTSYTVKFRSDTLVNGAHVAAVDATMLRNGVTALEAEYLFTRDTMLPLRIRLENNPGSISEQSVYIDYQSTDTAEISPISESWLIDRYPETFSLYRESNFSIEKLPGQKLPGFALPTTTGERYARRSSDRFASPTIVALLEAESGFTPQVIEALRSAAARMPFNVDIIWAFTDNVADRVETEIARPLPGEHLLMSARPLARDCGAASLPAILLVDSDATVINIIIGYNKDLASDVIQKMTLAGR